MSVEVVAGIPRRRFRARRPRLGAALPHCCISRKDPSLHLGPLLVMVVRGIGFAGRKPPPLATKPWRNAVVCFAARPAAPRGPFSRFFAARVCTMPWKNPGRLRHREATFIHSWQHFVVVKQGANLPCTFWSWSEPVVRFDPCCSPSTVAFGLALQLFRFGLTVRRNILAIGLQLKTESLFQ